MVKSSGSIRAATERALLLSHPQESTLGLPLARGLMSSAGLGEVVDEGVVDVDVRLVRGEPELPSDLQFPFPHATTVM